ncbi:MAG: hypothetical protein AAGI52_04040 [Bacteroidota bacterium]
MFGSLPLSDLVAKSRTLYTNARDDAGINATLTTDFGFDPGHFDAGLALVEEVSALDADQQREYGEQFVATEKAQQAVADLRALYSAHRRLGRAAHRRGSAAYNALGLSGNTPDERARLLADADAFYRAIEDDPTLADGVRGLTPTIVGKARDAVEDARAAMDAQTQEAGEAQRATALRDDAVARLRAHAGELAEVAKIGLADRPQLRERLGLLER